MNPLRKVLVVDDNPDDRVLVERRLHEHLPEVAVAHVGDQASLERSLAAADFDVVITDYQLRWSTGTDVLRRVKSQLPHTPVIMFTASGSEEVAVDAMKQGLDDYITKTTKHYARIPYTVKACHERASQRVELQSLLASLRERQRELEKADEQKNIFLATLAHELRNPLAPIRYAAAMLRDDITPAALRRVRDVLERQTLHMARLLDDLLDLGRISQNRIELVLTPLDLRHIVELAQANVRDLVEPGRHAWRLDMPHEAVWVLGDEVRLTQVVVNLLDNAAKFTPPGGQISVRLGRSRTAPHGGQTGQDEQAVQGEWGEIEIGDNGIGIAAEDIDSIFDIFTRAGAGGMKGGPAGLGIGLAVVRNLVRLHGGTVQAHSDGSGRGATFLVRLPMVAPPDVPSTPPLATPAPALRRLNVVVADDNRDAADAMGTLLGSSGMDVRVAYDGLAAMELAAQHAPDAMVLDLGMPRASGLEVAQWTRQQRWGEEVLLVAVSGWGRPEDRNATEAAGFDVHLVKPVKPEEVFRALQRSR